MTAATPKGELRRRALLEAVLAVLERGGPGAVTHRSVATEAGVPLAAATYYFDGRDDLLRSALRHATHDWSRSFDAVERPTLRDLAELMVQYAIGSRASALAQYELLFTAMRDEALREDADLWYRSLDRVLGALDLPADRVATLGLVVDGLVVRLLWSGAPATVDEVEDVLREAVG